MVKHRNANVLIDDFPPWPKIKIYGNTNYHSMVYGLRKVIKWFFISFVHFTYLFACPIFKIWNMTRILILKKNCCLSPSYDYWQVGVFGLDYCPGHCHHCEQFDSFHQYKVFLQNPIFWFLEGWFMECHSRRACSNGSPQKATLQISSLYESMEQHFRDVGCRVLELARSITICWRREERMYGRPPGAAPTTINSPTLYLSQLPEVFPEEESHYSSQDCSYLNINFVCDQSCKISLWLWKTVRIVKSGWNHKIRK